MWASSLLFGDQLAYLEGRYSYGFVENVQVAGAGDVAIDRSGNRRRSWDIFVGPLTFQFFTTWRHVHGGVDPVQLGGNFHPIGFHGQELKTRDWRMGGSVSLPVTSSVSVSVSYNDLVWGELVDAAHVFSMGLDWNFRLFGGLGSGLIKGN